MADEIIEEGRRAAEAGEPIGSCPYTFANSEFWPDRTAQYQAEVKPKFNRWWEGWKEVGMANNARQIGRRRRATQNLGIVPSA